MVIGQVHIGGVPVLESKHYAPVGPNRNAPETPPGTFQRMQSKTRQVYILRLSSAVQHGKDVLQFLNLFRRDASAVILFEEPLQTFVPEVLDHRSE